MIITIVDANDSSNAWTVSDASIKSYSDYREICLTGLALPDGNLTFTANMPEGFAPPNASTVIVYPTVFNSTPSVVRFVSEVKRIDKNLYEITASGYISLMTDMVDGDVYSVHNATVGQLLQSFGGTNQMSMATVIFKTYNTELSNRTIDSGRIPPCTRRDALHQLLAFTGCTLI